MLNASSPWQYGDKSSPQESRLYTASCATRVMAGYPSSVIASVLDRSPEAFAARSEDTPDYSRLRAVARPPQNFQPRAEHVDSCRWAAR